MNLSTAVMLPVSIVDNILNIFRKINKRKNFKKPSAIVFSESDRAGPEFDSEQGSHSLSSVRD